MYRHFYLLVPFRVAVIHNGLGSRVNHAKLHPNVRVDCLAIDWLYIFALVNIHSQLIALSLDIGGHHDLGIFLKARH